LSARAAWRLESLGFDKVFRYTAGKADWFANGLPREGKRADSPHSGDLARRDVATCRLTERAAEVERRLEAEGRDVCVVVNDERVVLGLARKEALASDPQATVEQVMESGPTTIRPNWTLEEIVTHMRAQNLDSRLVTNSDGQLMGILYRSDAEHLMDELQAANKKGV
jgi:predicted transcriptional regulator